MAARVNEGEVDAINAADVEDVTGGRRGEVEWPTEGRLPVRSFGAERDLVGLGGREEDIQP